MPSRSAPRTASPSMRSIAHRNAVSVLPVPVGADMSTFPPRAIAAQPSRCTGVGMPILRVNQLRQAGENSSSISLGIEVGSFPARRWGMW